MDASPPFLVTTYGNDASSVVTGCVSHVTSIWIGKYWGAIYGLKVNSQGSQVPDVWTGLTSNKATINLSTTQRVTSIKTWWDQTDCCQAYLGQIEFQFNNSPAQTITQGGTSGTVSTFTIPVGHEFVGFYGRSGASGIAQLQVYITCSTPSNSGLVIDLSSVNGMFTSIGSGATTAISFTVADSTAGACGAPTYSLSITPSSATASLIGIPSSSIPSIRFLASTNTNNAKVYTITVQAHFPGQAACPASATATYSYTYPGCSSASIQVNPYLSMQTAVGSSTNFNFFQWRDSVTVAAGNSSPLLCGLISYTTNILIAPSTFDISTMSSMFSYTTVQSNSPPSTTIYLAPTVVEQVGVYSIQTKACLTNFPTQCGVSTPVAVTVTPCLVTSVQIVQIDGGALFNQVYSVPSTTPFSYQLQVIQTPACGYSTTAWSASTTSTDNAASVASYNVISASGLLSVGPFSDSSTFGTYYLSIISVSLSVIGVSTVITTINTITTNAFNIAVTDGCADAVVTPSAISNISLKVFDASALYGTFASFTYSSTAGSSLCGVVQYTATIAMLSSLNALSTFSLNSVSQAFQIYSGALNQIGTYQVTMVGSLPAPHASISVQTTFTVEVVNPCLSTSIIWAGILSYMSTSVSVLDNLGNNLVIEQTAPSVNEAVSTSQTTTGLCGGFIFTVSDSPGVGVSALTALDLRINQVSEVLSVWTDKSATVGTHTVTVLATLTSYPAISSSLTFTLKINPCIVTGFTMVALSPTNDNVYTIAQPPFTFVINYGGLTTQVPACGYAQMFSSTNYPPILSVASTTSQISFTSYSRNLYYAGQYSIPVTSTLAPYPYPTVPTVSQTLVFTAINPCLQSAISMIPKSVENFVVFAGYTLVSKQTYDFNDSVTILYTLSTDNSDFCGSKKFSFLLNQTSSSYLTGDNAGNIVFSPALDTTEFGQASAQLFSYLESYPTIVSQALDFQVTILGSIPPVMTAQTYSIGSGPINVQFDAFKVLPESYNQNLVYSLDAYVLAPGVKLPIKINLQSPSLTPISNIPWATLTPTSNTISVFTSDKSDIGLYTIVLVQSFQLFPQVHPYASFQLQMIQADLTPLKNQVFILYWIGLPNPVINLIKYYDISASNSNLVRFSPRQTSGLDLKNEFSVNLLNALIINVTDPSLNQTQVTFQITATSVVAGNLPNSDLVVQVLFQALKVAQNATVAPSPTQKRIIFLFDTFQQPAHNQSEKLIHGGKTAEIIGISSIGLLSIHFYRSVYVPNFAIPIVDQTAKKLRQLSNLTQNFTLQEFFNSDVIKIQLQTLQGLQNLTWYCTNFTNQSITIQLLFQNPLEVSSQRTDQIIVSVIAPELFILTSKTDYLFSNLSQQTLKFGLLPQYSSTQSHDFFSALTKSTVQIGIFVIVITLILQIIAKKVISSMWTYYSALQIVLLVSQESCIRSPISVTTVVDTISGIINLSQLDKQAILQKFKTDPSKALNGGLLQNLNGVALAAIIIVVQYCL